MNIALVGSNTSLRLCLPNYLLTFGVLPKLLCTILLFLVSNHASFNSGFLKKTNYKEYYKWLSLCYIASISDVLAFESVFLPLDRYVVKSHIRFHILYLCAGL
jgi:hypothetical protein